MYDIRSKSALQMEYFYCPISVSHTECGPWACMLIASAHQLQSGQYAISAVSQGPVLHRWRQAGAVRNHGVRRRAMQWSGTPK